MFGITCAGDGCHFPSCTENSSKPNCCKDAADLDSLLNNTCLLIVPSKTALHDEKKFLESRQMIIMSTEEFLTTFQSLHSVPNDVSSAMKDCRPTGVKSKHESNGDAFGSMDLKSMPGCEKLRAQKNLSKDTSANLSSTVGTQTDFELSFESVGAEPGNLIHSTAGAPSKEHEDHNKKSFQNGKGLLRLSHVQELKSALSTVNSSVRNLWLKEFGLWSSNEKVVYQSASTYLCSHLALLYEFVSSVNASREVFRALLKRYLLYLKNLAKKFCLEPSMCEEIIKFDQALLFSVRKSGCWDFFRAWIQTEEYGRMKSKSSEGKEGVEVSNANFNKLFPEHTEHLSLDSPLCRTTSSIINRSSCNVLTEDLSCLQYASLYRIREESNCIKDQKRELNIRPSSSNCNFRVTTKSSSDLADNKIKQKRHQSHRAAACSFFRASKKVKRLKQVRTLLVCKYFNMGGCYKTKRECDFKHICSCCKSSFHGRRACPTMMLKTNGDLHSLVASDFGR